MTMTSLPACDRTEVRIPVRFAGGHGELAATLTVPRDSPRAGVVQLLVHGYSYARYYWDFPYQPATYSYVQAAARAGYSTLAIDRLGAGRSTRPAGHLLTWDNAALSVAAAVSALRRGTLGTPFDQVVLVGHSYGSVTSYRVADRHPGVDALIITGAAHRANLAGMLRLQLHSPSAYRRPDLDTPDPLYVTTRRGRRGSFYNTANAEPEVIALDEQLKQTAGALDILSGLPYLWNGVSRHTDIPVLTVIGQRDPLFARWAADCSSDAALAAFERRFYGPAALVEAAVVPEAGHNLNLELTAPATYARMLDFVDRHCEPTQVTE